MSNEDLEIQLSPPRLDIDLPGDHAAGYDAEDNQEQGRSRFGNPFESPTGQAGKSKYPPLFAAMAVIYRKNLKGVLTGRKNGHDVLSLTFEKGRIISVAHAELDADTIPDLLLETGLVSRHHYRTARRKAASARTSIELELVNAGRISMATAQNLLEATLTEFVLQAMADREMEFSFFNYTPAGLRRNCAIPVPFLLKEVQRRASELPVINSKLPDKSVAFVRTTMLESEPVEYLWEDLDLGSAEKQIYFYVDGHRTIDDLELATSQSRFSVMRSLVSLMDSGYVAPTIDPPKKSWTNHTFWNMVRSLSLLAVLGLFCLGLALAISPDRLPRVNTSYGLRIAAYGSTIMDSIRDRIAGAALSYSLSTNKDDLSAIALFNEGLIRENDIKIAEKMLTPFDVTDSLPVEATDDIEPVRKARAQVETTGETSDETTGETLGDADDKP